MRLIDADEIRWTNLEDGFGRIKECIAFATDIDSMPAVEVVRCKDCIHYTGKWCTKYSSKEIDLNDVCKSDNDYCSGAERKEE